jgi:hypothetical protein
VSWYLLAQMQKFRYIGVAIVDFSINACKGKLVERRGRRASGLRDSVLSTTVECRRSRKQILSPHIPLAIPSAMFLRQMAQTRMSKG